jgi:hypothetical protein
MSEMCNHLPSKIDNNIAQNDFGTRDLPDQSTCNDVSCPISVGSIVSSLSSSILKRSCYEGFETRVRCCAITCQSNISLLLLHN